MKPALRQLRDGAFRPRIGLPSLPSTAGTATTDQRRNRVSDALVLTVNKLNVGNEFLFTEFQKKLMKRTTAAVADALLGPGASPSLRLLVRRALRAAVAMASTANFFLRLCALATSLDHLDFVHDIKTDAELASAVDTILYPAVPPSLLVRATLFVISVLTYWLDLSTTTDSLVHMNPENIDILAGVELVLDLACTGPGLLESCRKLMKLQTALRVHDSGASVDMDEGDDSGEQR